jgi:probable HAF family extracellular repeat protein
MHNRCVKAAIICSTLVFLLSPALTPAQTFAITDLGALPGVCCSGANAINAKGNVVGASTDAFFWGQTHGIQDLGTLPGGGYSSATAINFFGEVAGLSGTADGNEHAVLITLHHPVQDLGVLPKATSSDAYGLNDFGVVVGDSSSSSGFDHAFLWTTFSRMLDLGTLPGGSISRATAVNDVEAVVGYSTINKNTQTHTYHAFLWIPFGGFVDLGTLPGDDNSYAYAVNQFEHMAGESLLSTAGNDRAVLWDGPSSIQDLGLLPGGTISVASALNDSDVVVGFADYGGSEGAIHAFIWTGARGMEDLNNLIPANSGWTLLEATGINVRGQIVGTGMIQGDEHAFLLTPEYGNAAIAKSSTTDTAPYFPNCGANQTRGRRGSVRVGCKRDER